MPTVRVDELKIAESKTKITLSGRCTITRDRAGLALAREFDRALNGLEAKPSQNARAPLFSPYDDESESADFGGFTAENRVDRISLFGEIKLGSTAEDVEILADIAAIVRAAIQQLEADDADLLLPDAITPVAVTHTPNPFA